MAELLKQQHDLAVLKLAFNTADPAYRDVGGCAMFTLEIAGQQIFEIKCNSRELNLPLTLQEIRSYQYDEPSYQIPAYVLQAIQTALVPIQSSGVPLWLEMADDCGNLPVIPWERLLQASAQLPILRLPSFDLRPFSGATSYLDVVLCATTPEAKWSYPIADVLDTFTTRILEAVRRERVVVHIFSDSRVYSQLQRIFKGRIASAAGSGVQLYDPKAAVPDNSAETNAAYSNSGAVVDNPWLRWIVASLGSHSADVAHFIGHGYCATEQGAIAFAESPMAEDGRALSRFVDPQQLATFAQRVGMWSIGFSAPERNFSNAGLRLLTERLAHLRPGPVLLHEMAYDHEMAELGEAYRFLYNVDQDTLSALRSIALYCHPQRVRPLTSPDGESRDLDAGAGYEDWYDYTLAQGNTRDVMESPQNTPTWIAASQRYLEQSAAELLRQEPASPEQSATKAGEQEALRLLSDVLMRHSSASVPGIGADPAPEAGGTVSSTDRDSASDTGEQPH